MGVLYGRNEDMAKGMKEMYDPFVNIARNFHHCPCCERDFSPEEEDSFIQKVSL